MENTDFLMKKYYFIIAIFSLALMLSRCKAQKELDRDLETAINHLPSKISAEDKLKLKESYYRGYHLYLETCSGCHGTGGRDTIPYFTFAQLDNYGSAAKKGDPENHAVLKKLSPEQVTDVLSFLFYRTLAKQSALEEKRD